MLTLSCSAQDNFTTSPSYYSDSCPTEYLINRNICEYQQLDSHRLCSRCPVELLDPSNTSAPFACLYGPDMLPFKSQNFFESVFGSADLNGDKTIDTEFNVYLVTSMGGTRLMCKSENWPTNVRDRVVAMTLPDPLDSGCNFVQVVEAAQKAGVRAIILVNTKLPGLSTYVTIPVGSVFVHQAEFQAFLSGSAATTETNGTARVIKFRSGVLSANIYQPPPEIIIPKETNRDILEETGVLICVIVAPFMFLATLAKAWHTAKNSVTLPHSEGVPLKAAVIGLTVMLSLLTAGVTLVLGVASSRDALDASSTDSKSALELTNTNSADNVKALTVLVMTELIQGGISAYKRWEESGTFFARACAVLVEVQGDQYMWHQFYSEFTLALRKFMDVDEAGWRAQVYTDAGMYYDTFGLSNARKQHENGTYDVAWQSSDIIYGPAFLNSTNDAWRYDYASRFSKIVKRQYFDPYTRVSTSQLPTGYELVLNFTDKIFKTSKSANLISRYNWQYPAVGSEVAPFYSFLQPLKSFKPEDRGRSSTTGALAVSMSVEIFSRMLRAGMTSSARVTPIAENMTVALFRLSDGLFLAADSESLYEKIGFFKGKDIEANSDAFFTTKLHNVWDTPNTAMNALVKMLTDKHGTLDVDIIKGKLNLGASEKLTVDFNQNGFEAPDPSIIKIDFDNNVVDTSVRKFVTELRGSCINCYSLESIEGSSLVFDGTLMIHIFPFITTQSEHVANTKVQTANGEWSSYVQMLNKTETVDGVPNVIVVPSGPSAESMTPVYGNVFHFMQSFSISVFVNPTEGRQDGKEVERPRIISDTSTGEGAIRWYADGMLKISVVKQGCTTESITVPQNRWSQLTAVVSFAQNYCAVYLNGVEVSRGAMTTSISLQLDAAGYTIGEHYKGSMDIFRVYKRALRPEEVAFIYNNPSSTTIRQGDSQWSAVLDTIGDASAYGGKLVMLAMVPTKDVTKDVDRNNALVSERLRIQEKNTQTKLDANQTEAAAAVLFILVGATFFVLLFTDYVTKPFAAFAVSIYAASTMDIEEEVLGDHELSHPIKELQVMQGALSLLMSNLRHFKSFVPLNLVEDIGAAAGFEDMSMVDESSVARSRRSGASHAGGAGRSSITHRRSESDSGSSTFRQTGVVTKLQPLTQLSLQRKKSSFLQINILDWHSKLYGDADAVAPALAQHASYLSTVIGFVMSCKGVPDTFSGDKILAAYNSVKPCQAYQLAACSTALKVRASFSESLNLSMSVVSATCRAGYMGSTSMKRYSYVGPVIGWSFALERLAKQLHCGILTDQLVADAVNGHVMYRTRGAAVYKKHSKNPIRYHEVLDLVELAHDEWMYMLDKAQSSPINLWNRTYEKVITRQWSEAEQLFDTYIESLEAPQPSPTFSLPDDSPLEEVIKAELERHVKNNEYNCVVLDYYY